MGTTPGVGAIGKAAVLVIDNQLGFMGISAATMNTFGKRVFKSLLDSHYDEVIVVVAHDRNPENNKVIEALKSAASRFGTVDMFVGMHTNMANGQLAQVPLFEDALYTVIENYRRPVALNPFLQGIPRPPFRNDLIGRLSAMAGLLSLDNSPGSDILISPELLHLFWSVPMISNCSSNPPTRSEYILPCAKSEK